MPKPTTVLQIALAVPMRHHFEYLPPEGFDIQQLIPGIRVRVPFRKKEMIGILIGVNNSPTVKTSQLKQAIAILDQNTVLSEPLLELLHWTSHYYHHPLGDVLVSALPTLLRQGHPTEVSPLKKKRAAAKAQQADANTLSHVPPYSLNDAQQHAIQTVSTAFFKFQTFLLHGVTGSGKTEVYLQLIHHVVSAGRQALILIPEIALTPQTVARFQERFAVPIAVLHSGLSHRERLNAWLTAKNGESLIVIGTRSAIFTPLAKPGIIIVDEEHDPSFKQQDGLRYSARDLAVTRGRLENIPVLLGSATPSLETLHNANLGRYHLLSLPKRAGNAVRPTFQLIDMRNQYLDDGLSTYLLTTIQQHLDVQGQVLIFLNRRGYAHTLVCHACGWTAQCRRCDAHLTLHHQPHHLHCHHCDATQKIELRCPTCTGQTLFPLGIGTERLELALRSHFPDTALVRIDRDTTRRKGTLQDKLDTIHTGQNRILIGTQMIAKGHHFPEVTLVAVLNADSGLYSSDFRASERIAQLITQVAGRAGREERPGTVLIQTYNPEHPLLLQLIKDDYLNFAEVLLSERQSALLPPYSYFTLLRAEATKQEYPRQFLREIKSIAAQLPNTQINFLGPIPSPMEKRAGRYRAQLLLQAKKRDALRALLPMLIIDLYDYWSSKAEETPPETVIH